MTKNEIGNYIKYLRKKNNYTQQQVADRSNIGRMTLCRLELGDRNTTLGTLLKILEVLNEELYIAPNDGYHNHLVQKIGSQIEQSILSNLPTTTRNIKYGWVYIINLKNDNSTIKIGLTRLDTPTDRLQTISDNSHPAMNPEKSEVELYYARLASNCEYIENRMHEEFREFKLAGEWFQVDCENAKNKLDDLINNLDTPHLIKGE
jgi:transcriptional regulator with XRE-family HTH domain